jgi:hypothetical protein
MGCLRIDTEIFPTTNLRVSYGNSEPHKTRIVNLFENDFLGKDYYPFGMQMPGRNGGQNDYRYGFGSHEKDDEVSGNGNHLAFGDYGYNPRLGRRFQIDPMIGTFPWMSPYATFNNSPIFFADPTGLAPEKVTPPSTHTDENGKVLAVYDDGDNSIYKHSNGTTKEDIDSKRSTLVLKNPLGAGGEKMGKTKSWDEFVNPETGNAMTEYRINFGYSWTKTIFDAKNTASSMNLKERAQESKINGAFDFKAQAKHKNTAKILGEGDEYITVRSLGNYMAGYNAQSGSYFGQKINFDTFQMLAGKLHWKNKHGSKLTKAQMVEIVMFGLISASDKHNLKPPYYGEIEYQYRMSKAGWDQSAKDNK